MTSVVKSPYTSEQMAAWLRGLLTIAWADGDFGAQEQELIAAFTRDELSLSLNPVPFEPMQPAELAGVLGQDANAAENFLRTAVMVAIADGIYSLCESHLLREYAQALEQPQQVLAALQHTLCDPSEPSSLLATAPTKAQRDALHFVRKWLDGLEIHDPRLARFLCKMIPAQCPFERDIKLFGHKIVHIPPLCKLNPLYEQLVGLRFRSLCYLAEECKEDVSAYC
ncbi:MAG: nitrogenase [Chroococcidiopsidaceae cyanobacterium CP_BM_ER_R8_30]|nr:nitrogenase [Chroococcidiopsidaceae cyanobacterium CP_BM_ER_R8_30]